MSVAAVARDAASRYRRGFRRYAGIAAVVFVALDLADALLGEVPGDREGGTLALVAVVTVVALLGSFLAYAALIHGGGERSARSAVVGAYAATLRRLGSVLAAGVVSSVGIVVGALLFVVPGLYLATRWSLVFQAIMLEGRSWRAAFGRSAELVRGHGWAMFGVVAITFSASAIALALPWAAKEWLPLPGLVSGWVVGAAADTLAFPYFALLFNVAYERVAGRPAVPDPGSRVAA